MRTVDRAHVMLMMLLLLLRFRFLYRLGTDPKYAAREEPGGGRQGRYHAIAAQFFQSGRDCVQRTNPEPCRDELYSVVPASSHICGTCLPQLCS